MSAATEGGRLLWPNRAKKLQKRAKIELFARFSLFRVHNGSENGPAVEFEPTTVVFRAFLDDIVNHSTKRAVGYRWNERHERNTETS